MRKRVINHVADTIFWYILYFLPVLAYLFFVISAPFRDITKEEGYTASVDYEVQYTCTIPSNSLVLIANSSSEVLNDTYWTACLNNYYYNSVGERVWFKYPVLVTHQSYYDNLNDYEHEFYGFDGVPILIIKDNWAGTAYDFTFDIPVPLADFTSQFQLYSYGFDNVKRNWGYIGINKTVYTQGVEYVATELAEGMTYDFKDFVNKMGFEFATDNIIVNTLGDIFGKGGVMPMFDNDTPFIIFAWFIGVYLLHLLVDFILFIPRIAHKWMKDCTGGD